MDLFFVQDAVKIYNKAFLLNTVKKAFRLRFGSLLGRVPIVF